jgi:lipoprotein NlpD
MPLTQATARRLQGGLLLAVAALAISGCALKPNRAPIEERSATPRSTVAAASPALDPEALPGEPAKSAAADSNSGHAGYYTIKPGDTLIRIGLDNGQNWKDLVRWNNLGNPNLIEVGQVIRIVPPGVDPATATTRPVTTARVETRPLDSRPEPRPGSAIVPAPAASASASQPVAPAPAPREATPLASSGAASAAREGDDDIAWGWPAAASVSTPFDDARNKGLVFRGKPGDPVYAAADGRVVYAGSGLRGYGNLIILKHNATYLTAYAHNQALLVKDDQTVKKGQKIAEMGSTDADSVQLHFEIRRQGKPIDPARLLPPR